jgi:hypothetical protein
MRRLIYLLPALGLFVSLTSVITAQAERLAGSDQGGRPLSATLLGSNEVPAAPDTSSGTASFTVNVGQGQLCYAIDFNTTETVVAAHIHHAAAGNVAPPLIPLGAPVTGSSSGCASVGRSVLIDILHNPGDYYVNVHTTAHPAGAGRGQLTK